MLATMGAPDLRHIVTRCPLPLPRDVHISEEQRTRILAAAPIGLRLQVLLCSDLALRQGSAMKLTPDNYNRDRHTLYITGKAGSRYELPATEEIEHLLNAAWPSKDGCATPYLQLLAGGRAASRSYWQKQWRVVREKLALPRDIRPHDLRRTTAVRALETTGDIRIVQELLGHRSLSTTTRYLQQHLTRLTPAVLNQIKEGTKWQSGFPSRARSTPK